MWTVSRRRGMVSGHNPTNTARTCQVRHFENLLSFWQKYDKLLSGVRRCRSEACRTDQQPLGGGKYEGGHQTRQDCPVSVSCHWASSAQRGSMKVWKIPLENCSSINIWTLVYIHIKIIFIQKLVTLYKAHISGLRYALWHCDMDSLIKLRAGKQRKILSFNVNIIEKKVPPRD